MDKLEYLNTIAKDNRSTKPAKSGISGSLIAAIALGGILIFIIIMILGSVMNSSSAKTTDLTKQLYSRTTAVSKVISSYEKSLKSSKLRAISLSLSSTLSGAEAQLKTYMSEKEIDTKLSEKVNDSEATLIDKFDQNLTRAKLNGILDRIYANQIQLQVSLLLSLISQNLNRAKNDSLISILNSYRANLATIEQELDNYSSSSD